MKYTFILLNMVSCLIVRAQADFVVPFKGDTLTGEAKILSFDKIDRVQITSHGKKTIFQSTQVRSLRMNQDLYRAVRYENSIRMMKMVKDGYLSLLAFKPEGQSNSSWSGQYLLKRDGQGVEVPNLSFKKILSNFLGDCPDIKDHFQKGDFSKHDLNRIVDLYNTCLDVKTKNLNGQPKTVEISTDKVLAVKQFIEKAGLKGTSVGGAMVSDKHANFIVNAGGATAQDVKFLIDKIKKEVFEQSGITLEEEVEFWGFNG